MAKILDKSGTQVKVGDVVRVYGGEYCQGYWEYDDTVVVTDDKVLESISNADNIDIIEEEANG